MRNYVVTAVVCGCLALVVGFLAVSVVASEFQKVQVALAQLAGPRG